MNDNNTKIKGMELNKITLAFQGKNEILFLEKYFSDSLVQFRIAFFLVTFLYAAFGYLDLRIVPQYAEFFHIIRYYFVVPLLSLVLLSSFTPHFRKVWQLLLFISFIVSGAGISIMTMLVPENYAYYAGLMLIFSAGYFFIKLRFFMATLAGWITLLIFNLGAIFYAKASTLLLINDNFFFISANLIGMFAAYNIEYFARRDFILNQELDSQKDLVENANRNLEKIVEKRTAELMEAKNKAEQSDQLKSAFLANMSHEIRTPMNGILGFAELLKTPDLSGDQQQEYIGIIRKSGDRMLNIINDIVDISKIEAGLVEMAYKQSNINEQTEFIYKFFKPQAEAKGIILSYKNSLSFDEAFFMTDKEKVYAILTNLIKNAIKYTDKGSIEFGYNIDVEDQHAALLHASSLSVPQLRFYVKDTGIGVPIDRQQAIFDRFIQADIADKRAFQGAGLGLSIAKAYVSMLKGNIWIESNEKKGSTFYFTIPFNKLPLVKHESNTTEKSDPDTESKKKLKVLIVEDDETSEMLVRIAIKQYCREVFNASTGTEAIEACRLNPDFDLVLMDIKMPVMDGYEATRQIRKFNKNVIIIAQTAYGLSGDDVKSLAAGCNSYITKPLDLNVLTGLIEKHLNQFA